MNTSKPKQFPFSPLASGVVLSKEDLVKNEAKEKKFTREDIERAEKNGFDRGQAAGQKTGLEQGKSELFDLEQKLNAIISSVSERLGQVIENLEKTISDRNEMAKKLSLMVAKKIVGDELKNDPTANIEKFIQSSADHIFKEKSLSIKVNSKFHSKLEEFVKKITEQKKYSGKILVIGDANVPESYCEIDWERAGIEYNQDKIWSEIEKILGITIENNKEAITKINVKEELTKS